MKNMIALFAILLTGCATLSPRAVYVPDGQAVRLAQPIKHTQAWVRTEDGKEIKTKMDIPEGWYCLPK